MTPERRQTLFERIDRATDGPMLVLSVAFLAAVALPEMFVLSQETRDSLELSLWIIWGIFAFELGVKTYLAPNRGRYLLTHWMDVLSVAVPFLRPIRVLVAGLRVWGLAREALRRRTLSFIGVTSVLSVFGAAFLVYAVERGGEGSIQTFGDAVWWAAATITTVGYGDVYPRTPVGRGLAVLLMLVGISLFGVLTARVAAFFVEATGEESGREEKLDEVLRRLSAIEARLERVGSQEDGIPQDQVGSGGTQAARRSR